MIEEKFPIVVLISGNGSNLQAIINDIENKMRPIEIKAVLSNKASAYGLERAKKAGIATVVLNPKDYPDRASFDAAMQNEIDSFNPKLVVLAGYMRILSDEFVKHYHGRLINIHPSLLPKFKGLNTHQRALDAKEEKHGCSIHFVSEELDAGEMIAQMECDIASNDTAESLQQKVHQLEHILYPEVINWFAEGRVKLD